MSYSAELVKIIAAVEGATPYSAGRGGKTFRHSDEQIEAHAAGDNRFQVLITRPPQRHGQVATTTPRFSTGWQIVLWETQKDTPRNAITELCENLVVIQNAIADEAATIVLEDEGEDLFTTSFETDGSGNLTGLIEFSTHHQ